METWKEYIISFVAVSICCGVILQLVSQTGMKVLVQIVCGVILSVTLLTPVLKIRSEEFPVFTQQVPETVEAYLSQGKDMAERLKRQYIMDSCEAYILDKAQQLGAEISASISLGETFVPCFAEIQGNMDPLIQKKLENILTEDMGITKENQLWIGNPENIS